MSRLAASAAFALVLITGTAFALDAGVDASLIDGGIVDANLPDVGLLDGGAGDAETDAGAADATTDASLEAGTDSGKDAAPTSDASGACCPSLPCTCPSDAQPQSDAGDAEESGANGGCSCDSAPAAASTTPIAFVLAALLLVSRRKRR